MSAAKLHALKSPSSSMRWTLCHASIPRIRALAAERKSNAAADVGTIIHDLGEHALTVGERYVIERQGTRAEVKADGTVIYAPAGSSFLPDGHDVTSEMCDAALSYSDFVLDLVLGGADLHVEQRLSIEHITDEPGAKGTSDAVLCFQDELCVVDLKGGFIRVKAGYPFEGLLFEHGPQAMRLRAADGEKIVVPNPQLTMYAAAALKEHGAMYAFEQVRLIVHQPRLNAVDQLVISLADFEVWVRWISEQAKACELPNPRTAPSEETCRFCPVFPCREAQDLAVRTAIDDFENAPRPVDVTPDLGKLKTLAPLVRMWADAVDAKVLAELTAGREVEGWKLVPGEMGDRKWADEPDVTAKRLHALGLSPEHYQVIKIVGPASVESLVRRSKRSADRPLSIDQWNSLQEYITREPGGPKVVPSTDPRDALVVDHTSDFDVF